MALKNGHFKRIYKSIHNYIKKLEEQRKNTYTTSSFELRKKRKREPTGYYSSLFKAHFRTNICITT